jgi:N-methylhydantoinase A
VPDDEDAEMTRSPQMTFAVDTGGTFTDLLVDTGSELRLFKALTTHEDPVDGVLDVLAVAAEGLELTRDELLAAGGLFIHGTTRAINAVVTSTTARTAFLTTEGHPDILLFREGGRSEPFDFSVPYPAPLVPRALTFEIRERIWSDGSIVTPLDETSVLAVIDELEAAEVEAVGVALLWSIVNPAHELRLGELLAERLPGVPFTLSHRLNPTLREYRRASSTCIDASLKPLMARYFESLEQRLRDAGFAGRVLMVTSQGGVLDARDIAGAPIHSLNSGPSMAPVAGRFHARSDSDRATAIVADTGGTTFDVSLVRDGHIPRTRETWIGPVHRGHITGFPSVDVTSVGAGGGSIAWVDNGGLLHVGPRSAGSEPGPACYGRGGLEATLTDACLVLGYLDPEFFLGGSMRLDEHAASAAVERSVARPLGLGVDEGAAAILRIATENMVHAIEAITINQGMDPREAVLVGGGGAAGLNAVAIARRLGCPTVLIPETGAALSAAGALLSELSTDFAVTHVTSTDAFDFEGVNRVLADLTASCSAFAAHAAPDAPASIEYSIEARYPRQNWEIEVEIAGGHFGGDGDVTALAAAFHGAHEQLFAISEPDSRIEIVTWRARVRVPIQDISDRRLARRSGNGRTAERRRIHLEAAGWIDAAIVDFEALDDGARFSGPTIVESSFTTVVVDVGVQARKTARGTLALDLRAAV